MRYILTIARLTIRETQRRRIDVYFRETAPLLDYYREKELLVEIDGERGIEEIQHDLIEVIKRSA